MGIGRSPRKLLKAALDPLETLEELLGRYPEARAELEAHLGPERLTEIGRARSTLRQAVDLLVEQLRRD